MAIKKTLAQNHLSDLASQGRGGDTELAHVNPQEKAMLKAMGGSGGINPNTGLREYAIDPISLISLGVSLFGAGASHSAKTSEARSQSNFAQEEINRARKSIVKLGDSRSAQTDVAHKEFTSGLEDLSSQTGIASEDLLSKMDDTLRKSNISRHGSVDEKKSKMWGRLQNMFTTGKEGLLGQLGKKMGGIEEYFEGERSRLGGIIRKATLDKKLADRASEQKFLGIF